tara:strand:- start:12229 stop:12720 length:492 start_codon:yes stop_codon:yes gene_type:complete
MDRRIDSERRSGEERRQEEVTVASDRREGDRRTVQRRRHIDPTTCERDYSNDEIEFMHALDAYKRASGRMFPTCSEILEVLRDLGYARIDQETESVEPNAEGIPAINRDDETDQPHLETLSEPVDESGSVDESEPMAPEAEQQEVLEPILAASAACDEIVDFS